MSFCCFTFLEEVNQMFFLQPTLRAYWGWSWDPWYAAKCLVIEASFGGSGALKELIFSMGLCGSMCRREVLIRVVFGGLGGWGGVYLQYGVSGLFYKWELVISVVYGGLGTEKEFIDVVFIIFVIIFTILDDWKHSFWWCFKDILVHVGSHGMTHSDHIFRHLLLGLNYGLTNWLTDGLTDIP